MHPLEVSPQSVPIRRDVETEEAFLQSCRSGRMVSRDVLRTLRNTPKKLPAYLALVAQLLVQQVGPLVAVPQVSSHPVLAVGDGGTERAAERLARRLLHNMNICRQKANIVSYTLCALLLWEFRLDWK